MDRPIVGFSLDDASDWMAELSCGHRVHRRHDPPRVERPWVLSAEGRAGQLGTSIDCTRCDRGQLPKGHVHHKSTPDFDQDSIPAGLLANHTTKVGVWGVIRVLSGRLEYVIEAPFDRTEILDPERTGTVLPEVPHRVAPLGAVRFRVEFWRKAPEAPPAR